MTPPSNLSAERAVLGACLLSPESIALLDLGPTEFYLPAHAAIWRALKVLATRPLPMSILAVWDELMRSGEGLALEGGERYLLDLADFNSVPVEAIVQVRHFASMVRRCALLRRVIEIGMRLQVDAQEADADPGEILTAARRALADVEGDSDTGGTVRLSDKLGDVFEAIGDRQTRKQVRTVSTGINTLDEKIYGFRPGQLVVVAGRPGQGKTALAGCLAHSAATAGIPTLVFSLEMAFQELAERFLGIQTGREVRRFGLDGREALGALMSEAGPLMGLPLWINDRVLSIGKIAAIARSWRARHDGLAMVVLDYIGLVRMTRADGETREQQVGNVAWASKTMAKDLGCPFVLLAQLNRSSEKENREPVLADLRESGQLEQHADMVIFPERGKPLEESGPARLIVAKNRGGATGGVDAFWRAESMQFVGTRASGTLPVPHWTEGGTI